MAKGKKYFLTAETRLTRKRGGRRNGALPLLQLLFQYVCTKVACLLLRNTFFLEKGEKNAQKRHKKGSKRKLFCRFKRGFFELYLPSAVRPTTELEIALLIVKRKPCNVYLAGALKDAWRDIEAAPLAVDDNVRLEGAVEFLVRAVVGWGSGWLGLRGGEEEEKGVSSSSSCRCWWCFFWGWQ